MNSLRTIRRFRKTTVREHRLKPNAPRRGRSAVLAIIGFALLVGFGLLYVGQVNTVATSGLATKDLNAHIRQLQRENQDLELKIASLKSLSTVEQASRELNLQVRANVAYLPLLSETVARSR